MSQWPVTTRFQSVIDDVENDRSGTPLQRMERYANLRQDLAYAMAEYYMAHIEGRDAKRKAGALVFEKVWERAHAEGWPAVEQEYAEEAEFQAKIYKITQDYLDSTRR